MRKGNTFYCFSPPVMLVTLVIEFGLAIYILLRYRKGIFGKVAAVTLICLGIFQFSEYQICSENAPLIWSRVGLVVITLLPVLGLYLVSLILHNRHFLRFGYTIALLFILIFILVPKNTITPTCGGNYVIFNGPQELYRFYSAYYFGFLMLAIWEALTMNHTHSIRRARILRLIVAGYLSFMLPMAIVYAVFAPARWAVTSIMCGFAVIFALILALQVVPKYYKLKK
jgi:hypothetical protein